MLYNSIHEIYTDNLCLTTKFSPPVINLSEYTCHSIPEITKPMKGISMVCIWNIVFKWAFPLCVCVWKWEKKKKQIASEKEG